MEKGGCRSWGKIFGAGMVSVLFFLNESREKSTVAMLPDNYEKNKSIRGRE